VGVIRLREVGRALAFAVESTPHLDAQRLIFHFRALWLLREFAFGFLLDPLPAVQAARVGLVVRAFHERHHVAFERFGVLEENAVGRLVQPAALVLRVLELALIGQLPARGLVLPLARVLISRQRIIRLGVLASAGGPLTLLHTLALLFVEDVRTTQTTVPGVSRRV